MVEYSLTQKQIEEIIEYGVEQIYDLDLRCPLEHEPEDYDEAYLYCPQLPYVECNANGCTYRVKIVYSMKFVRVE